MSLEHAKYLKMPFYCYSCTVNPILEFDGADNWTKTILERHLHLEHTIVDDRVIRAMKNKADTYKRYYMRHAMTFGFVVSVPQIKDGRYRIFGGRNNKMTFLQEKEEQQLINKGAWNSLYLHNMIEESNVDKKFYERAVRALIKEVS